MGFTSTLILSGLLWGILWIATQIRDNIKAVRVQNEQIIAALERLTPVARPTNVYEPTPARDQEDIE